MFGITSALGVPSSERSISDDVPIGVSGQPAALAISRSSDTPGRGLRPTPRLVPFRRRAHVYAALVLRERLGDAVRASTTHRSDWLAG